MSLSTCWLYTWRQKDLHVTWQQCGFAEGWHDSCSSEHVVLRFFGRKPCYRSCLEVDRQIRFVSGHFCAWVDTPGAEATNGDSILKWLCIATPFSVLIRKPGKIPFDSLFWIVLRNHPCRSEDTKSRTFTPFFGSLLWPLPTQWPPTQTQQPLRTRTCGRYQQRACAMLSWMCRSDESQNTSWTPVPAMLIKFLIGWGNAFTAASLPQYGGRQKTWCTSMILRVWFYMFVEVWWSM